MFGTNFAPDPTDTAHARNPDETTASGAEVSNNSEYQREIAKSLVVEGDCVSAYELAKQYGWEGVMEQIRYMSRTSELD